MANGYLGDKAVQLPNMFPSPGQALATRINDINQANERQFELDYRHQKDQEAEDWRKLNLINELTDLSKYHTGSDVADAIGFNKMNEVYQKYTAAAGQMSPAELQARIQKDMGGIISGMNATKEELNLSDEQLKVLKQKYPSLDVAKLGKDYREEILKRRIGGNDFNNPLTVGQSTFDIQNPDTLSKYVSSNSRLRDAIQNPKGSEMVSVLKGNRSSYTPYTAKITPFKRESFDRGKLKEGFMTTAGEPKLEIKASAEPGITINGQPFMMMDEDIYKNYSDDPELIYEARKKFKDYDSLTPDEKEKAKRNAMYDLVKELDQSEYRPERPYTAPTTRNYINTGKQPSKIDLTEYPDVGGGTKDITSLMQGIDVVSLVTGKGFSAEKVTYNPSTKRITITDPVNKKPEEMSLTTFLQNIRPQNAAANINWLKEGLENPIVGTKTEQTTKKEIKRSEIETKAAAAGYSAKEYEELLIKNGVKIVD